jgi:hypothetical protein
MRRDVEMRLADPRVAALMSHRPLRLVIGGRKMMRRSRIKAEKNAGQSFTNLQEIARIESLRPRNKRQEKARKGKEKRGREHREKNKSCPAMKPVDQPTDTSAASTQPTKRSISTHLHPSISPF